MYKTMLRSLILSTLIVLVAAVGCLLAAPLKNVPVTVVQPNGAIVKCFASGDEYYNWLHDQNNYTIVQDEQNGYYTYAVISDGALTSSQYIVGQSDPELLRLAKGVRLPAPQRAERKDPF